MKHFLFYLLIFAGHFSFSQRSEINIWLKKLEKINTSDTIAIQYFNYLAQLYGRIDSYDTSLYYANRAIDLAEKFNYKKHLGASFAAVGSLFVMKGNYSEAESYYQKALEIYEQQGNKLGIAQSFKNLALLYDVQTDYDKELEYLLKAEKLYYELKDNRGLCIVWQNAGSIEKARGNYSKANIYYLKSLKLAEADGNKEQIGVVNSCLGDFYFKQSNYSKALDFFLVSLKMFEQIESKTSIANALTNIGAVYAHQKNKDKSNEYFFKALKIYQETGNKSDINNTLYNIGHNYLDLNNLPKALEYYSQTLKISEELNDKIELADCLSDMGYVYFLQKKINDALACYNKSIEISKAINYKLCLISSYNRLAILLLSEKKYVEGERLLNRALLLADSVNASFEKMEITKNLSEMYEKTGNYQKALDFYKKAVKINDTLFNEDNTQEITRKEMNYEFEKKTALAKAEEERKITEYKNQKARLKLIIYLVISLFVIGGLLTLYISNRIKKARIIAEQQKLLQATIETQEQERKRIAEDLHDGVGQSLIVFKNILSSSTSKEDLQRFNEIIEEVRSVSHQMMPAALTKFGLTEALQDLLSKNKLPFNCKFEATPLKERLSPNIEINLYRVVQELINNIIKHAEATEVEVQLYKSKNQLIITVEDNGIGFNMNNLVKNKGIGISNIKSRLQTIHGEITYEKSYHSGTLVIIKVPIVV